MLLLTIEQEYDTILLFLSVITGIEYGEMAVGLDDNNADAHKWFALLTGSKLLYEPNAVKIKLSYVYKVCINFII